MGIKELKDRLHFKARAPNENEEPTEIMEDVVDSPEKRKGRRTYKISLQLENKEALTMIVMTAVTFIVAYYVIGIVVLKAQYLALPYKVMMEYGFFSVTKGLMSGRLASLVCVLGLAGVLAAYVARKYLAKTAIIDDRNIIRSKSGRFGQNDWLNNDGKMLEKTFTITDIDKPVNLPLCIYKNKAYCIPMEPKFTQFKNMNVCIAGSSGSGKSYSSIEPMVLQRLAHQQSFIVADTKGALYNDYAAVCEKCGYDVKVFNTKAIHNSNAWNCLQSIVNADEGNMYDLINTFAQVFIDNTADPRGGAAYWDNNEKDLLKLLLHYVCRSTAFKPEERRFDTLVDIVAEGEEELSKRLEELSMNVCQQNASTIAYAKTFASKPANLRENYISGLINKLQVFRTPMVAAALSYDDINFEEAVHKPTAIFLVTSDSDSSYDVVTALFVTSAYLKLIEISDSRQYAGKLKIPFWLILDELCNMAAISDLSRKMATNRSRNICIAFAIQSLGQLEERYGKLWETIVSNCGTFIYLGCNDETTSKYISTRAGKFTQITTTSMTEKPNVLSRFYLPLHKRESKREEAAELIPSTDAQMYGGGNVLVFVAGKNVMKGAGYAVDKHPLHKYKKHTDLYNRRQPWLLEYAKDENGIIDESKIPDDDMYTPSEFEKGYDIKNTGVGIAMAAARGETEEAPQTTKRLTRKSRKEKPKVISEPIIVKAEPEVLTAEPEIPDTPEPEKPAEPQSIKSKFKRMEIAPEKPTPTTESPFAGRSDAHDGTTGDLSADIYNFESEMQDIEAQTETALKFNNEVSYVTENPHDTAMEMAINCDGDGDYTDDMYNSSYDDDDYMF